MPVSLEALTSWFAVAAYALATMLCVYAVIFGKERLLALGLRAGMVGFASQTVSILIRLWASGRLPVAKDYENALAGSWTIMLVLLLLVLVDRRSRPAAAVVLPIVLVTLGFGATAPMAIEPLTPAYRSGWLVVHVSFAWVTYAAYSAAAGVALLVLLREAGSTRLANLQSRLPGVAETEDLMTRLVGAGVLLNAVMIASGAIWAYRLWGSYWAWDPVETWSLITWLAYALYLHLRLIMGWTGKKLAWLVLFALFGVLMTFWGVQLIPSSYHLFRNLGDNVPQVRPK